jgi:hypothetical protein
MVMLSPGTSVSLSLSGFRMRCSTALPYGRPVSFSTSSPATT